MTRGEVTKRRTHDPSFVHLKSGKLLFFSHDSNYKHLYQGTRNMFVKQYIYKYIYI